MKELYADDYYVVHRDDVNRIVVVTRTALHGDTEGVVAAYFSNGLIQPRLVAT